MRNNIIRKEDYDTYSILLPVRYLFGKKREKYIFEELEKRHPCFSSAFAFDCRIGFQKGKCSASVVVIKKIKLLEYKRKNLFSDFGFLLENNKTKVKGIRFINQKKMIFMGLLLIAIIPGILKIRLKKTDMHIEEKLMSKEETEINNEHSSLLENYECDFGKDLLAVISNKNGEIKTINWKIDDFYEEFNASLRKIYPDDFENLNDITSGNVIYSNGIPEFTLYGKKNIYRQSLSITRNNMIFFVEIRNAITQGGELMEEKNNPLSIKFRCENGLTVLENVAKVLMDKNVGVKELKVVYEGSNKFLVELMFSDYMKYENGIPLEIVSGYSKLFMGAERKNDNPQIRKIKNTVSPSMKKIGAIGYENGRKLVFYKGENGKILKVMEN